MTIGNDLLGLVTYAAMITLTLGAKLAHFQAMLKEFPEEQQKRYRSDMAFCLFLSLIPIVWVLAPFFTGFYEDGLQYRRRK